MSRKGCIVCRKVLTESRRVLTVGRRLTTSRMILTVQEGMNPHSTGGMLTVSSKVSIVVRRACQRAGWARQEAGGDQ